MKRGRKVLIIFMAIVISIIAFESYVLYTRLSSSTTAENGSENTKNDDWSIGTEKYIVDIYTPYSDDNLNRVLTIKSEDVYYYLIDGLLDKDIENRVNEMIEDTIEEMAPKFHNKRDVVSYIYSNFENTISIIFGTRELECTPEQFDEEPKNNTYIFLDDLYFINVDLTTGNTFSMKDVINNKDVLRSKLLEDVYERASKNIGLVCSGGPCINENPDYKELEDSVLSIMNKFNKDDYLFGIVPEGITFAFNDVYMYNPTLVFADEDRECDLIKEEDGYKICSDYQKEYSTFISFVDLVDNVIIYDRFKSEENIYENDPIVVDRKFIGLDKNEAFRMDDRMVESENELIDYIRYGEAFIEDKLYKNVVDESSSLRSKDFNIFNITENYFYVDFPTYYTYHAFYVYHYNMPKLEYQKYKRDIYLSKYNRYNWEVGEILYKYGYDYLSEYLDKKAYYYYLYDEDGNQISTSDVISDTFDFSTIIPDEWLSSSKYSSINAMVKDSLLIIGNPDFVNDNHLVIYYNMYYGEDDILVLKYKGKSKVLAKDYLESSYWVTQIFK